MWLPFITFPELPPRLLHRNTKLKKLMNSGNREVIAHFDGGDISSDAGGLLLREVEQRDDVLPTSRSFLIDEVTKEVEIRAA